MPPGVRPQYTLAPTVKDRQLISYNSNSSKGSTGLTPEQLAFIANNTPLTQTQQAAITPVGTISNPPKQLGPPTPPGFWEDQARQDALLGYAQASGGATNTEDLSGLKAAADALLGGTAKQPVVRAGGGGGSAVDPMQALMDQVNGQISAKYDPQQLAIQNALDQLQRDYAHQQDATKTYGDVMSKRDQELYDLFGKQFSDITNQAVGQADASRQRIAQNTATSQQNVDTGTQALQAYLANQAQQIGGPQIAMAPIQQRDNGSEKSIIDALLTSRVNGLQTMQAALPQEAAQLQGNLTETILSKLAGLDQGYNTNVATQQSNLQQLAAQRAGEMQSLVAQAQQQAAAAKAKSSGGGSSKKQEQLVPVTYMGQTLMVPLADALKITGQAGIDPTTGQPITPTSLLTQQANMANSSLKDQNDADALLNYAANQSNGDLNGWISQQSALGNLNAKDAAAILEAQNRQKMAPVSPSQYTATQKRILAEIAKYGR